MKLHYYRETDSLYDLPDRPSAESREVAPGVVLDFDASGINPTVCPPVTASPARASRRAATRESCICPQTPPPAAPW